MLLLLIRKEIVSHVLSLRFAVTFVLFIVLIFASIYVTVNAYLQDRLDYGARVRANKDHLADIMSEEDRGRGYQRLFWDEGRNHAVPPAELSWLGQGLQPGFPAGIHTTSWEVSSIDRGMTRNPLLGLFRSPDFVYVVSSVLSLLAILFMFDAVCGEKEAGTLRLQLSNSVPRHLLLLGKWIGGYAALLLPFLIATAGGLGYAWAQGVLTAGSDAIIRVLFVVALACIYIAVFFNISLFVSTTTGKAATSLLICLLVWVSCIVVVPNLGPVTARIIKPAPSHKTVNAAKRAVDQEINLKLANLTLISGELNYGSTVQADQDRLERERKDRKRKLDNYLRSRQNAQMDVARTLGRLSPAACWTYGAVALAGTGPDAYRCFQRARDSLSARFSDYVEGVVHEARKTHWRVVPELREEDIPTLRISVPDRKAAVTSALNDTLILLILNVVFFMLAFMFFLRYDVR